MTLQWLGRSGQLGQVVTLKQGTVYRWRSRWDVPCSAATAAALDNVRAGLQFAGFSAVTLWAAPGSLPGDWPTGRKDPAAPGPPCTLYAQARWPLPDQSVDVAAMQVPGIELVDLWEEPSGTVLFGPVVPTPFPKPPAPTPTPTPTPGPAVPAPGPVTPPGPPPPGPPPPTPEPPPPTEPRPPARKPKAPEKGLSTGAKIGIGVAAAGLAFFLFTR